MSTILLVIHLMIAVAMIILILLQRSEGGALGIGGNSNNGLMTGRGLGRCFVALNRYSGWHFLPDQHWPDGDWHNGKQVIDS